MIGIDFNDAWLVSTGEQMFFGEASEAEKVNLPHDAQVLQKRDINCRTHSKTGYYTPGTYTYKKKYFVDKNQADKKYWLEFEGVYMNAMVYVNGDFAAQRPYGYSQFAVDLTPFLVPDTENEIKVVAKTSEDSRWYTGIGLYRPVNLYISDLLYIPIDGVKIATPEIDPDQATVIVRTTIKNEYANSKKVYVNTVIKDRSGFSVAEDSTPVTLLPGDALTATQRLTVNDPALWSVEHPSLYHCETQIREEGQDEVCEQAKTTFGIRSLQLDTRKGLRINGEQVKMRGACIHHDNGVLGAATFDRAEERRVELMKMAGFNAIRSSHHPMSRAMLRACDRLGMLVMDETFDMWTTNKSDFDYALSFPQWWQADTKAMIDKDFNHPCVIMYSIGNEIPDTGKRFGGRWSRQIADYIRALDASRYTINSINSMVSTIDALKEMQKQNQTEKDSLESVSGTKEDSVPRTKDNKNTVPGTKDDNPSEINSMMTSLAESMRQSMGLEFVIKAVEEAYAAVDIAGYNYMDSRYLDDHARYPNRVICGSETFAPHIDINWRFVKDYAFIIGDFTWTGWDYLGEAAIGKVEYDLAGNQGGIYGKYPWYIAFCGDFDILGNRRPASYYREIVWGLRNKPYIAVQRPVHYGKKFADTPWSWTDSLASWTWPGFEGKPIKVEVYADADEVELFINDKSAGRLPVDEANRFRATFDTKYEYGTIKAVSYKQGQRVEETTLESAGEVKQLLVDADREQLTADGQDLAYVMVALGDDMGRLNRGADRAVSVSVDGPAVVQGFGSADPKSEALFSDKTWMTFDGYVLAVIRSSYETGLAKIRFEADGCKPVEVEIEIKAK